MKWKEQLRKDKQTLAGMAPRQKMLFIWDYYKLPILSLLLVAVLAGAGAAAAARSAHTAFYAVMVNANNEVQADPFTPLLEQGGVDMTGKSVDIEANYTLHYDDAALSDAQTLQVLAALFGDRGFGCVCSGRGCVCLLCKAGSVCRPGAFYPGRCIEAV